MLSSSTTLGFVGSSRRCSRSVVPMGDCVCVRGGVEGRPPSAPVNCICVSATATTVQCFAYTRTHAFRMGRTDNRRTDGGMSSTCSTCCALLHVSVNLLSKRLRVVLLGVVVGGWVVGARR